MGWKRTVNALGFMNKNDQHDLDTITITKIDHMSDDAHDFKQDCRRYSKNSFHKTVPIDSYSIRVNRV